MGLLWVVLTLTFETVLGFVIGKSFSEIVKAYDMTTGNLWLFVVVFIGLIPWLIAKIKHSK